MEWRQGGSLRDVPAVGFVGRPLSDVELRGLGVGVCGGGREGEGVTREGGGIVTPGHLVPMVWGCGRLLWQLLLCGMFKVHSRL